MFSVAVTFNCSLKTAVLYINIILQANMSYMGLPLGALSFLYGDRPTFFCACCTKTVIDILLYVNLVWFNLIIFYILYILFDVSLSSQAFHLRVTIDLINEYQRWVMMNWILGRYWFHITGLLMGVGLQYRGCPESIYRVVQKVRHFRIIAWLYCKNH